MSDPVLGGPVVVDTNVFTSRLGRLGHPLFRLYEPALAGRPVHLSFVTLAEARYGARLAEWGPRRCQRLEWEFSRVDVIWPDDHLTEAYVELRARCQRVGHGLAQKAHEADRWVAATALWLGVELVAHDAIFKNVPGLPLITELSGLDP